MDIDDENGVDFFKANELKVWYDMICNVDKYKVWIDCRFRVILKIIL